MRPPASRAWLSGRRKDRILGFPFRSSLHSFQERGPPGHAAGLSTSLRNLWGRRKYEAPPTQPRGNLHVGSVCLTCFHWPGKAEAEKTVMEGRGRDTYMIFPCYWLTFHHFLEHSFVLFPQAPPHSLYGRPKNDLNGASLPT